MSRGRGNVFSHPDVLEAMLKEYSEGYGFTELGKRYGVAHSSIYYQVKKYGVERRIKVSPQLLENMTSAGNLKYKRLVLEELEWLKGAKKCETCQQTHPPMKYFV